MALVKLNLTRIAKTSAMHLYLAIGSLVLAAFQTINHYYAFFFFKCFTRPIGFKFINKKLLLKKKIYQIQTIYFPQITEVVSQFFRVTLCPVTAYP